MNTHIVFEVKFPLGQVIYFKTDEKDTVMRSMVEYISYQESCSTQPPPRPVTRKVTYGVMYGTALTYLTEAELYTSAEEAFA